MAVSYNKLWKLSIDRKISQVELRKSANIAQNTMTKLRRDQYVAMPILDRICDTLGADFSDIVTHVPTTHVPTTNIMQEKKNGI